MLAYLCTDFGVFYGLTRNCERHTCRPAFLHRPPLVNGEQYGDKIVRNVVYLRFEIYAAH